MDPLLHTENRDALEQQFPRGFVFRFHPDESCPTARHIGVRLKTGHWHHPRSFPSLGAPDLLPLLPVLGEGRESKDERSSECEWQMNCYMSLFA